MGALAHEDSAFHHLAHGHVGIKLVEHGLFAEQLAHQRSLRPGHTQEPGEWAEEHAKDGLEVEFGVASAGPAGYEVVEAGPGAQAVGEDSVEQRDHGGKDQEHYADVGGHFEAVGGAVGDGFEPVALAFDAHARHVDHGLGLGNEYFGDPKRRGGVHHRGGQQVAREEDLAFRIGSAQVANVGGQYRAGERGHAAHHEGHEFGAGHSTDVGFDEERSLGLAHKHVGGGGQGFGTRKFEGPLHDPGKSAHDALQNSEMEKE